MALIVTVSIVFLLLCISEIWWRTTKVHTEISRKFVHISVGSFVAFWPFFLTWQQIELLSLAFLIVVGVSKHLNIMKAIHSVQRPTWGEIFFALAVGLIALLTNDKWIYMTALLQMSLADGLAAIVGLRYGKRQTYLIFGQVKSLVGSLTFFIVSIILLLGYRHFSGFEADIPVLFGLAFLATAIENLGIMGLDNLFVPLLIVFGLRM